MVQLLRGDCLELMKQIPDKSIDAVITDPPYGSTCCAWDSVVPLAPMWEQLKRIIKPNGAIVLFGSQPFTSALIMSNLKMFKYEWVWDKHIPRGFQVAKYRPMNKHENILVFGDGKINYYPIKVKRDKPVRVKNYSKSDKVSSNDIGKYNDKNRSFLYTYRNPDTIIADCWEANAGKKHPTQKPVALMEYLIKTYTNEGETVLDFTAGSGTLGVAAINTNRNAILIERDAKYCEIIKKRITEAEQNKANRLFVGE
jgi:site-specific DNA-methyltransferase (adenine-specific)